MSDKVCDHTSVGMIVYRGDAILLIERKKPPFGFAAPAGHVDGDASFEEAARRELKEEVGLDTDDLNLVIKKDIANSCRRQDGDWHHWEVYETVASGEVAGSADETKQVRWVSIGELKQMAAKTSQFLSGGIPEADWNETPGLEPVWYQHFQDLGILER